MFRIVFLVAVAAFGLTPATSQSAKAQDDGPTGSFVIRNPSNNGMCAPPAGHLELYQHDAYRGQRVVVPFGTDVPTLDAREWAFNDSTSSIRYVVPAGWECQLCQNRDYGGWSLPLRGSGEIPKFEPNDSLTSVRWLKLPE